MSPGAKDITVEENTLCNEKTSDFEKSNQVLSKNGSKQEVQEIPIEDDTVKEFCSKMYSTSRDDQTLCMIKPYDQVFRTGYLKDYHQRIQDFEIFEDDVWISTFPRSGTRWTQELVWCLRNNMDFEKAKSLLLDIDRVPFFEFSTICPVPTPDSLENVLKPERPRTIKTHLSYDMLPKQISQKGVKIINVIRNPRDVCASHVNHLQMIENYSGNLDLLVDVFLKDLGPNYAPFFKHILSYWNQKQSGNPNILVIFYEDMQRDIQSVIKKIATFLEVDVTDDSVKLLAEHISFKNMRVNPMTNMDGLMQEMAKVEGNTRESHFIHKGKTGSWVEAFDQETIKRFEEWEAKWLDGTGLSFTYKL